jgi:hypothetical protein
MPSFALAAALAAQVLVPVPQPATAPPLIVPALPPTPCCVLPALTPVLLSLDEAMESDKAKIGQYFRISLREPVRLSDSLVIPAGTTGSGQVVHAAKSRAMGKAGELVLAARFLDYQGRRIPLRSLRYGKGQGKDNVDTAVIVGVAVSALITPFITGGEVRIPAGTELWAKIASQVDFAAAAASAPIANPEPTEGVK